MDIQPISKISEAVESTSNQKKKPKKYPGIAIDYRMISMENEAKQKQLKPQKILSVSLFVAITRMSSANRAYNVIIDIIIEK